ncbi:MAG TPA: trimeric intracellular cation channel family protein, partial [Burkholderiales bacterium]|nr:trimeric intracellular cation channel family protein [Burkholderiales bacterium]
MKLDLTLRIIEAGAIIAFALSGFLEAARKRMDVVGVVVVAFITAFGGGTLRDILLDRRPLVWVEHQEYVVLILALAVAGMLLLRGRHLGVTERAIQIPDALGLGLFSVSGTSLALEAQMPMFVASLMGVITAVFGGVMRDIICNEIPTVFRDHRPYA